MQFGQIFDDVFYHHIMPDVLEIPFHKAKKL